MEVTNVQIIESEALTNSHIAKAQVQVELAMKNAQRPVTKQDFQEYVESAVTAIELNKQWAILLILILRYPQDDVLLNAVSDWAAQAHLTKEDDETRKAFAETSIPKMLKALGV